MAEAIGARQVPLRRVAKLTASLGFVLSLADPWRGGGLRALASVAEEIVFRGGVQTLLLRWPALRTTTFAVSDANALTSTLFAAFHLWRHSLLVARGVLPVSLVLGHVREAGGGTVVSIVLVHVGVRIGALASKKSVAWLAIAVA